ncbi:hypothetical protein [Lentzea sp. NBRC 102530]|uniref:hypothetical protein n=1 Tax=Lentzea sp. NBRC 102530 TaxID=3032201 RepID=UPI0024A54DDA|nr:hypothetical protein [Lentzea sp. NBRC 102530]GLY55197.1 hypothetical protein Lesp01_88520 [Lentzea sp. NBRC 102530]
MTGDEAAVLPEGCSTVAEVFEYGQCHALALALHARTGWPIVGLHSSKLGDTSHYLVRRPDGLLVDVRGTRTEQEVLEQWDAGYPGFYTVRDYQAVHLWAEVQRDDMEDPADVWPLAQQTAARLAGAEQDRPKSSSLTQAAASTPGPGSALEALLPRLEADWMTPESKVRLLRRTAENLSSYMADRLTQAENLERAAAAYDERGLDDLAGSMRREAQRVREDADRDEAEARALNDVAAELVRP